MHTSNTLQRLDFLPLHSVLDFVTLLQPRDIHGSIFCPFPTRSADHIKRNTDPTRPTHDDAKSSVFKIQY